MNEIRKIGIPSPRVEGQEKVTGSAIYAEDIMLPEMLWAKVLRSPVAHARIKKIDVTQAAKLPGVKAVVTGAELAGVRIGKKIVDMPVVAETVVRYIGEKVAAVAAETEAIAETALDLIDVEYEDLQVLTDPLQAVRQDAPFQRS